MFKAEIGDFLYIIIFIILMLAGGVEKYIKAKKQQPQPPPPQSGDDYDDEGEVAPSTEVVPERKDITPQYTLEEMLKRMLQVDEVKEQYPEEVPQFYEEAQSLEVVPEEPKKQFQPTVLINKLSGTLGESAPSPIEEEIESVHHDGYDFDFRNAVIASEILNRKYQ